MLVKWLGVMPQPLYCTKIASRLTRTYTDRHGLKDLTKELLGKDISKQQQSTDWGAETLSEAQVAYAADDVLNLHALKEKLDMMLAREGRDGTRRSLLRFPADPRPARSRRLGRGGHFLTLMSSGEAAKRRFPPAAQAAFRSSDLPPRRGHIRRRFCKAAAVISAGSGPILSFEWLA